MTFKFLLLLHKSISLMHQQLPNISKKSLKFFFEHSSIKIKITAVMPTF